VIEPTVDRQKSRWSIPVRADDRSQQIVPPMRRRRGGGEVGRTAYGPREQCGNDGCGRGPWRASASRDEAKQWNANGWAEAVWEERGIPPLSVLLLFIYTTFFKKQHLTILLFYHNK
jgi:hypothetical protein